MNSPEFVLDAQFDAVRRYIRRPHPGEAWPYVEFQRSSKLVASIGFELRPAAPGLVLAIGLFQTVFLVDLLGRHLYGEWVQEAFPGSKQI